MAFRLAVVCLAAAFLFACGGGGGGGTTFVPQPQWGRARADNFNTGVAPSSVTNTGEGSRPVQVGASPIRTTPAIGLDGTVIVATESDGIFAFDPDLNRLWNYNDASAGQVHSSVTIDGFNNIFYGTDGGFVIRLLPEGETVQEVWTTSVGSRVIGSPLLVIDTVENLVQALFVATSDGRIIGIGGDGQIRWQFRTGGAVDASVVFDGITLYAPSADGFLYSLTQSGGTALPSVRLGEVGADFRASPSLFGQVLAQSGLVGAAGGGRVRAFTTAGTQPIWERDLPAPVPSSPTQYNRVVTQRLQNADRTFSEILIPVTDFLVVDENGTGWLLDPQIGTPGTRCIGGGLDDAEPCSVDGDCRNPTGGTSACEPTRVCVQPTADGPQNGEICRSDIPSDCTGGVCTPITKCEGGDAAGNPCVKDADCTGGKCNFSIFSVNERVEAAPVSTTSGTILVATLATGEGGGTVYAIEPPKQVVPTASSCRPPAPAFCQFDQPAAGPIRSSPSVANDGVIYFGDDTGKLWIIPGTLEQ